MKVVFDHGESRHVKLKICNVKNEPFEIVRAEYQMIRQHDKKIIDSGAAMILGHILDVVITPPERESYLLKYTYVIGDETLVDIVEVSVL